MDPADPEELVGEILVGLQPATVILHEYVIFCVDRPEVVAPEREPGLALFVPFALSRACQSHCLELESAGKQRIAGGPAQGIGSPKEQVGIRTHPICAVVREVARLFGAH